MARGRKVKCAQEPPVSVIKSTSVPPPLRGRSMTKNAPLPRAAPARTWSLPSMPCCAAMPASPALVKYQSSSR